MNKNLIGTGAILALGTALISGASGFVNKFAVTAMNDPVLFATIKNIHNVVRPRFLSGAPL